MTRSQLNFSERLLSVLKETKTKTPRDAAIALVVVLVLYVGFSLGGGSGKGIEVPVDLDALEALEEAPEGTISLAFGGDVILARYIKDVASRSPESLLGSSRELFASVDLGMANLETSILADVSQETKVEGRSIYFDAEPSALELIQGIDIVTMANNHMADYGRASATSTLKHLDAAGIIPVGGGQNITEAYAPHFETFDDFTLAFIGFTDILSPELGATQDAAGVATTNVRRALPAVRRAADSADLVIVNVHWGIEYMTNPTKRQYEIAKALAGAGADVIIGHHPHVLQPISMLDGSLVFFSLGNLVSDQGWTDTREVVVPVMLIDPETRSSEIYLELFHIRDGRPQLIDGGIGYYKQRISRKVTKDQSLSFDRTFSGLVTEVQF